MHSYTVYGLYEKSSFRRCRLLQRHTTHVLQKANRHMSMAANAPPPAAPMMMYIGLVCRQSHYLLAQWQLPL